MPTFPLISILLIWILLFYLFFTPIIPFFGRDERSRIFKKHPYLPVLWVLMGCVPFVSVVADHDPHPHPALVFMAFLFFFSFSVSRAFPQFERVAGRVAYASFAAFLLALFIRDAS